MEAFGRVITVLLAAFSMAFLMIFSKTSMIQHQKNETVRSLVKEYVTGILEKGWISRDDQERFLSELEALGAYELELTVYERRRYEGENGRVYLFTEWKKIGEEKKLLSGSYLRLTVTERNKGKLAAFFYGEGCTVTAGGRIS